MKTALLPSGVLSIKVGLGFSAGRELALQCGIRSDSEESTATLSVWRSFSARPMTSLCSGKMSTSRKCQLFVVLETVSLNKYHLPAFTSNHARMLNSTFYKLDTVPVVCIK